MPDPVSLPVGARFAAYVDSPTGFRGLIRKGYHDDGYLTFNYGSRSLVTFLTRTNGDGHCISSRKPERPRAGPWLIVSDTCRDAHVMIVQPSFLACRYFSRL